MRGVHQQSRCSSRSLTCLCSGRAGRDRNPAISVTYYSTSDKDKKEFLMQQEQSKKQRSSSVTPSANDPVYEATKASFQSLVDMCSLATCRRRRILEFFAEKPSFTKEEGCKNCDYCSNPDAVRRLVNQNTSSTRGRMSLYDSASP